MANEHQKIQSQAVASLAEQVLEIFKKVSPEVSAGDINLEFPPDATLGDYSVPCFILAKKIKMAPAALAQQAAEAFVPTPFISQVKVAGPYFNFFVNRQNFMAAVFAEIGKAKSGYGGSKIGKGQKVMVEYFSPNTNKPLTVGHVRNICLGSTIANLFRFSGYKVITTTLYNDRGIAIAKAMLGYQKWGKNKTPKSAKMKPDHFVGSFYVRFSQEEKTNEQLSKEALRMLQAWENDDKTARELWQKLMTWVLEGFKQTIKKFGIERFDEEYHESEFYDKGKQVVEDGLKKGVFVKNQEGLVYAELEKFKLPNKIVLRPDATSLYITQDLYLAYLKDKHNADSSIYVVGSEQDLYFQQLFKILELLGFKNAERYHHLSYGMIRLPEGKIKSREGLAEGTGADDLLAELESLAKEEIVKRSPELDEKEIGARAEQIALGALKFYILAVDPKTTMIFNPKQSIAFTGKTGPYLQYVYARINSIFAKAQVKPSAKVDAKLLTEQVEFDLVKLLAKFPEVVSQSVKRFDPSELSSYLFDLAKTFSLFYEQVPILQGDKKIQKTRLLLIKDIQLVLATGLGLLGITTLEKM
ncbi:MAG: arginine--tRNA ligase [Candidatus Buchananbacteria bacterium]|nr:arginine--tRNA ligase [Candidatus Buchananbacteria bacterium]